MPRKHAGSRVEKDAAELYDAATDLIRFYQFRDRNTATRYGLTIVQAYALERLVAAGELGLLELAASLRLDKSTTSRIVAGMDRHGLIEVLRSTDDQRSRRIVASAEGRRRYNKLRRAMIRENAELLATYSVRERRAIVTILRQLTTRAEALSGRR